MNKKLIRNKDVFQGNGSHKVDINGDSETERMMGFVILRKK